LVYAFPGVTLPTSDARGRVSLTKLRTTFNGTPPNLIGVLGGGDPWQKKVLVAAKWDKRDLVERNSKVRAVEAVELPKVSPCGQTRGKKQVYVMCLARNFPPHYLCFSF
jgi:hypothetical protein